jgi:hypothetical protein
VSKAQWGQSAHNWNAAIDLFCELEGDPNIYDKDWFYNVLAPAIPGSFSWYGRPNAPFFELPHVELSGWNADAKSGALKLVENQPSNVPTTATNPSASQETQTSSGVAIV